MARLSKDQKEIRLKAISEAIEELKGLSTPVKNMVSFDRVVELANERYGDQMSGKISLTTLKVPTTDEYKALKKQIEDYRDEHKNIKSAASTKSKSAISSLDQTVQNLMSEVAKFYDEKLLLTEKIDAQTRTIEKLKVERDHYRDQLNELKAKHGS